MKNKSGPVNLGIITRNRSTKQRKVTFNLKTTVHEYEKLKYVSEDSSDGEDELANNNYLS